MQEIFSAEHTSSKILRIAAVCLLAVDFPTAGAAQSLALHQNFANRKFRRKKD